MPKPNSKRSRQFDEGAPRRGRGQMSGGRDAAPVTTTNDNSASRRHVKPSAESIRPLNARQRAYDAAFRSSTVIFGTGVFGTGKTFFAACRAAEAYRDGEIERIIITRPNVEAAEDGMGFLPGEAEEKFEPYFRPVREALEKVLGTGLLEYALRMGDIEARPLAFMRGATFDNCWVIADEMQNATRSQMKLLLSRIGEGAKFIINGDEDQCDLADPSKSGLMDAVKILSGLSFVSAVSFGIEDIVRSGPGMEIAKAYAAARDGRFYNSRSIENDDAGLKRILLVD